MVNIITYAIIIRSKSITILYRYFCKALNLAYLSMVIVCAIFFISCDNNDVISSLNSIPQQKILHIPTYEGFNCSVHPDIVYFNEGYKGHYFYMSFTPFPFGEDKFENPSILVSDNGVDFYEEVHGINPIVSAPPYGHNDDPDLLYNYSNQTFHLYYLETMIPDSQNVVILTSENGILWQRTAVIHYDLKNPDPFILSPAGIQIESEFLLFFVNSSIANQPIQYLRSEDGIAWNPDEVYTIEYVLPQGFAPWHIDIFSDGNFYYLLVSANYPHTDLYIAVSSNLEQWTFRQEPILDHKNTFLGPCDRIYRSSGVAVDDLLIVWFSFMRLDGSWGIGIKKFNLSALFNKEKS